MGQIEIFNKTEKYLIVNSVEINGNKLSIPPRSSGRGSGRVDEELRDDAGIQELLTRGEITIRKANSTKKTTAQPAQKSTRSGSKKTSSKRTSSKKTSSRKTKKTQEGTAVVATGRGTTKRVSNVPRAEDAFIDADQGGDGASEEQEYSPAFIDV